MTRASIRTKFHGPTNHRGSRIIASDDDGRGRVTVSYDHALNADENHAAAAQAWLDRHNPYGAKVAGPGASFGDSVYWTWSFDS